MAVLQADLRLIDRVVGLLRSARRLLFITGAGLSADSGLPTYRGETVSDYAGFDLPPRCRKCQAILRPSVVLFGEELPETKMVRLWSEVRTGFDVVFSVGTSSSFPYIAAPVLRAREMRIPTVEINPESTAATRSVDLKIAGRAAEVLDLIWRKFLAEKNIGSIEPDFRSVRIAERGVL